MNNLLQLPMEYPSAGIELGNQLYRCLKSFHFESQYINHSITVFKTSEVARDRLEKQLEFITRFAKNFDWHLSVSDKRDEEGNLKLYLFYHLQEDIKDLIPRCRF